MNSVTTEKLLLCMEAVSGMKCDRERSATGWGKDFTIPGMAQEAAFL